MMTRWCVCRVRLYDVFETPNELYIIMELCLGGELFDRIKAAVRTCGIISRVSQPCV